MDKYIGKYRVDIERDLISGDPLEDGFTYLRCVGSVGKNGGSVYRYNEDTLVAYIPSKQDSETNTLMKAKNVCEKFDDVGVSYETEEYDNAMDIYFSESDLDKVWEFLSLTKNGAGIAPKSIKNHIRKDEIRQERLENMSDEERERRRISAERLSDIFKRKAE